MKYARFSFLMVSLVGAMLLGSCGSQSKNTSAPLVTDADMALFEEIAKTKTLPEVCAEVKGICETDGKGCSCYEHFCKDQDTEQSVCAKLQDACVSDCKDDAACKSACAVKDTKCSDDDEDGEKDDDKNDDHGNDDKEGHHHEGDHDGGTPPTPATDGNTEPPVRPV